MGGDVEVKEKPEVTVTSLGKNGYEVKIKWKEIGEKTITLADRDARQTEDELIKIGADEKHLLVNTTDNWVILVENEDETDIVPDKGDDTERDDLVSELIRAWDQRKSPNGGSRRRRSRLNRKAKRTKRNSRNLKRSKLRKLTTRRR
jgi:hypothetical protein